MRGGSVSLAPLCMQSHQLALFFALRELVRARASRSAARGAQIRAIGGSIGSINQVAASHLFSFLSLSLAKV